MRTNGPGGKKLLKKKSFHNEANEETLLQIRDDALKNKRSVGQDTLRSLTFRGGRGIENVAPWL